MSAEQRGCGAAEAMLPALRQSERFLAWSRFEEAASASLPLLRLHPLSRQLPSPAASPAAAEAAGPSAGAASTSEVQPGAQLSQAQGLGRGPAERSAGPSCAGPSDAVPEDTVRCRALAEDSAAGLAAQLHDGGPIGAGEASESNRAGSNGTSAGLEGDVLLQSEACEAAGAVWLQALDRLGRHQDVPDELIRTFGHIAKVPETLLLVWFSVEAMRGRSLALSQILSAALQPTPGAGQQGVGAFRVSDAPGSSSTASTADCTAVPTREQLGRLLELHALLVLAQGLKDGAAAASEVARGEDLGWITMQQGERLRRAIGELERQQVVQRRQEARAARAKRAGQGGTREKDAWANGDAPGSGAKWEWRTDPGAGAGPSGLGKANRSESPLQNGVAHDREDNASDSEAMPPNGGPWSASGAKAAEQDAGAAGGPRAARRRRSHGKKEGLSGGSRSHEHAQQDALHNRPSSGDTKASGDGSGGGTDGKGVLFWPVLVAAWRLGDSTRVQCQAAVRYVLRRAPWLASFGSGPALFSLVLAAALVLVVRHRASVSRALRSGYQRVRRALLEAWLLAFSVNLNPMVQSALPQ